MQREKFLKFVKIFKDIHRPITGCQFSYIAVFVKILDGESLLHISNIHVTILRYDVIGQ